MIDPAYYINESKNSKASSSSSTNPKMDTTPHDSKNLYLTEILNIFHVWGMAELYKTERHISEVEVLTRAVRNPREDIEG